MLTDLGSNPPVTRWTDKEGRPIRESETDHSIQEVPAALPGYSQIKVGRAPQQLLVTHFIMFTSSLTHDVPL